MGGGRLFRGLYWVFLEIVADLIEDIKGEIVPLDELAGIEVEVVVGDGFLTEVFLDDRSGVFDGHSGVGLGDELPQVYKLFQLHFIVHEHQRVYGHNAVVADFVGVVFQHIGLAHNLVQGKDNLVVDQHFLTILDDQFHSYFLCLFVADHFGLAHLLNQLLLKFKGGFLQFILGLFDAEGEPLSLSSDGIGGQFGWRVEVAGEGLDQSHGNSG